MSRFHNFCARHARAAVWAGFFLILLGLVLSELWFRVRFLFQLVMLAGLLLSCWGLLYTGESRLRRILRRCLAVLVCLGLSVFLMLEGVIAAHCGGDPEIDADYLIVLGCGLYGDRPTPSLRSRLTVALDYLERHPKTIAVLSGGRGPHEDVSEAAAMERWLLEHGLPEGRILPEDQSHNTIQNLENSFALIPEGSTVAAVSNDFHLYRIGWIGEKLGRTVHTLPAPTPTARLNAVHSWVRESASIFVMYLKFALK